MATQGPVHAIPLSQSIPDNEADVNSTMETQLDEDIARIRAEIQSLTKRRNILSSTLLSATSTQSLIDKHQPDPSPLATVSKNHATTNIHRIALPATSFSFTDPSEPNARPLLGVRFDICTRGGQFVKPYYLLLQRVGRDGEQLRVHRHTIPVFIPLRDMEEKWLPVVEQDEDEIGNKSTERTRQDLQKLVQEVRAELVSWHARSDAIEFVREGLGLNQKGDGEDEEEENESLFVNEPGIKSVAATSLEARYVRIQWKDGRVGRLKLTNEGLVERAVVLGEDGREKRLENMLVEGTARVEDLVRRLASYHSP